MDRFDLAQVEALPAETGSYALQLVLYESTRLVIGRLGAFSFPAGQYIYLGSALGAGGLRARIRHHARITARPHWHLDWLRVHAVLLGGWYAVGRENYECRWSQSLVSLPGARVAARGFGATDCRGSSGSSGCPAHLVAFPAVLRAEDVETALLECGSELHGFCLTPVPALCPNLEEK